MLVKMRKIFTSEQQLYYQLHRILEVSYRDPAISLLTENISEDIKPNNLF